jgi:hypothetical protein
MKNSINATALMSNVSGTYKKSLFLALCEQLSERYNSPAQAVNALERDRGQIGEALKGVLPADKLTTKSGKAKEFLLAFNVKALKHLRGESAEGAAILADLKRKTLTPKQAVKSCFDLVLIEALEKSTTEKTEKSESEKTEAMIKRIKSAIEALPVSARVDLFKALGVNAPTVEEALF